MLQNTGAVISIAFVLAIVTAAVPKDVLFKIFSGVDDRAVATRSSSRSSPTCTRRCGCSRRRRWSAPSCRSCARPTCARTRRRDREPLRIGEVAERAGTTPRTIRYYEEIGLLPGSGERVAGEHRDYTEADVERLREVLRLKQLLGLSLDELRDADARRGRARRAGASGARRPRPAERRRILDEALGHIDRQLELVRRRRPTWRASRPSCNERRQQRTHLQRELGDRCGERRPGRRPRGPLRRAERGRRRVLRGRARRGVRPARPQRRRQDDDPARAHHAAAPDRRAAPSSPATTCARESLAVRASIGYVPQALSRRRRADRGREPRLLRPGHRRAAPRASRAHRRGRRGDGARAAARRLARTLSGGMLRRLEIATRAAQRAARCSSSTSRPSGLDPTRAAARVGAPARAARARPARRSS